MIDKDQKLKRMLAWLPARLYELGVRLRVAAYETEYLKPRRLEATVISVGNIAVGGTGKTPMVHYIARYLKEEGHSIAVLTRGYGRKSKGLRMLNGPRGKGDADSAKGYEEFGDEPLMLARALPDIPVIINKDRYESGAYAESELGAGVLVLDDAYQHLALARDF
jgi:tetraacyldisaccharide 4'-kinase